MNFLLTFLISLNLAHSAVNATNFEFKPEAGKVEFKTKGWPNLVTIKGEGKGVTGTLKQEENKVNGALTFNLDSLDTGIDLRDDHMKNTYLEVKKFPTATLTLTDVAVPEGLDGSFDFKGTLQLHGEEQTVTGKAELENNDGQVSMKAEVPIKLSDFKIPIPEYKGITVAEKVTINIESKVTQQ